MGQFKPMVKMMTTEPSIELKLKKGGHVSMKDAKGESGHKMMKGGMPDFGSMGAKGGMKAVAAPKKPGVAARRAAMKKMKEGGESSSQHKAEMKKMAATASKLKKHESMPASKAHKGLKTGGVVMGQGGFAAGGVIKSTKGKTMMHTAEGEDHTPKKTGEVVMGKPGGYKKGGKAMGGISNLPTRDTGGISNLPTPAKPGGFSTGVTNKLPPGSRPGTGNRPGNLGLGSGGPNIGPGGIGPGGDTRPPSERMKRGGKAQKMAMGGMPVPMGQRGFMPEDTAMYDDSRFSDSMMGGMRRPARPYAMKKGGGAKKMAGGGCYAKGGGVEGNVSSTPPGKTNTSTGEVKLGNAGGYKKGGAPKKAYAAGGSVNDSGRPVAYPKKPASQSVKNTKQSGTFRHGGGVKMNKGGIPAEAQSAIKQADNERAYREYEKAERAENEAMRESILGAPKRMLDAIRGMIKGDSKPAGSVTKTEKSVTVTPSKKRGGSVKC